jgi:ubiquinone/menaquinone biosynthesis C-methylase UbiE
LVVLEGNNSDRKNRVTAKHSDDSTSPIGKVVSVIEKVQLNTPEDIRNSYEGSTTATSYVRQRFTSELSRLLHERQVSAVQRVFNLYQPSESLEIAPGPGRITRDVHPSGRLVCLEYNSGMIAEGRRVCSNSVEWIQGDAFHLPFERRFEFVYSFRFIRHFHRPDRERLYHEIRSVLIPGGTLVIDAVNERVSAPLREKRPEDYPIYDKLYRNELDLTAELLNSGFEVVRIEPVQRWYPLQYRAQVVLGPRSRWLCRRVIQLFEGIRRGQALEWIVTCRRA